MKKEITIPTKCPSCESDLIRNGPFLECSNVMCPEVQIHRIMKWVTKHNIMHLSRKTLDKLIDAKLVSCISDLYSLTLESVQSIEGISVGFQRVLDEIEKTRNCSLAKFLSGFDMDGLGETIWQLVIDELNLSSLTDVFAIKFDKLGSVKGIGPLRAEMMMTNLVALGEELIKTAKIVGIAKTEKSTPIDGNLSGKSFCFTGALNTMKRAQAEELVKSKGGTISSVNKSLSYLVTNDTDTGSSKNVKASSLGIAIINEQEFLSMVKS